MDQFSNLVQWQWSIWWFSHSYVEESKPKSYFVNL